MFTPVAGHVALAGRISYALGLSGPSLQLNAACATGLTAVHMACQSLTLGDSELALAGAVNLMLTPHMTLSPKAIEERFAGGDWEFSAFNAPEMTVVSGSSSALDAMLRVAQAEDVYAKRVDVSFAAHSAAVAEAATQLRKSLRFLQPRPAKLPIFSSSLGGRLEGELLDAEFWQRNLRQPVQFQPAVLAALEAGVDAFVELGPHAVLAKPLRACAGSRETTAAVLPTMLKEEDDRPLLESIAQLFEAGLELDWSLIAETAEPLSLPSYPWQHRDYWPAQTTAVGGAQPAPASTKQVLGAARPLPLPSLPGARRRSRQWSLSGSLGFELNLLGTRFWPSIESRSVPSCQASDTAC